MIHDIAVQPDRIVAWLAPPSQPTVGPSRDSAIVCTTTPPPLLIIHDSAAQSSNSYSALLESTINLYL
jgi:hypothetical protein